MAAWEGDGRDEGVFADWTFEGLVEAFEGGWRVHSCVVGADRLWRIR